MYVYLVSSLAKWSPTFTSNHTCQSSNFLLMLFTLDITLPTLSSGKWTQLLNLIMLTLPVIHAWFSLYLPTIRWLIVGTYKFNGRYSIVLLHILFSLPQEVITKLWDFMQQKPTVNLYKKLNQEIPQRTNSVMQRQLTATQQWHQQHLPTASPNYFRHQKDCNNLKFPQDSDTIFNRAFEGLIHLD